MQRINCWINIHRNDKMLTLWTSWAMKSQTCVQQEHHVNMSSPCSEFQWLSRLPVTGELDGATLRQMSEPRCGVSDEGSQQIWAERVNAIFAGRRRPQRRRRRSSAQGGYIMLICVFLSIYSEDRTEIFSSVCKLWCNSLPCRWRLCVCCCGVVINSQQWTRRVRLCKLKH